MSQPGHSGLEALQRGLPGQVRRQRRQALRTDLVVLACTARLDARREDVEVRSVTGQVGYNLARSANQDQSLSLARAFTRVAIGGVSGCH